MPQELVLVARSTRFSSDNADLGLAEQDPICAGFMSHGTL